MDSSLSESESTEADLGLYDLKDNELIHLVHFFHIIFYIF